MRSVPFSVYCLYGFSVIININDLLCIDRVLFFSLRLQESDSAEVWRGRTKSLENQVSSDLEFPHGRFYG